MRVRRSMRARRSIRAKKPLRARKTVMAGRLRRAKGLAREKREKREQPTLVAPIVVAETAIAPIGSSSVTRSTGAWAFVTVMVFLSAAAMLSAALRAGEVSEGPEARASQVVENLPTQSTSVQLPATRTEEPARPKESSRRLELAKRIEPAPTESVRATAHEVEIQPAALALGHITPVSIEPLASTAPVSAGQNIAPVAITGCLEQDDNAFRLKDASGEAAPKARSWKSGFLRKSTATISVIDSANRLALANHVGRRVTVTGTLVDREMQARGLQRVAQSCDQA
jgi:hypothetical protein